VSEISVQLTEEKRQNKVGKPNQSTALAYQPRMLQLGVKFTF